MTTMLIRVQAYERAVDPDPADRHPANNNVERQSAAGFSQSNSG
jgi:hypothetical protein